MNALFFNCFGRKNVCTHLFTVENLYFPYTTMLIISASHFYVLDFFFKCIIGFVIAFIS